MAWHSLVVFASVMGPWATTLVASVVVTVAWMACWVSWGSIIAMSRGWVPSRGAIHGLFGPVGIAVLLARTRKNRVPAHAKASYATGEMSGRPSEAIAAQTTSLIVSPVRIPRHLGLAATLVACVVLVVSVGSLFLGWVDALSPEQAKAIDKRVEESVTVNGKVGSHEVSLDPTVIPQLNADKYVHLSGWEMGAFGTLLATLSIGGAALVYFAGRKQRPVLMLVVAMLSAMLATTLAMSMVLIEWVNFQRFPFVDRLPRELQSYLPDSHAGPGMWLYVSAVALTTVLVAVAAVGCYNDRYGLAWEKAIC